MKPRYKVDLSRLQAVCDANYLRLMKLMPELDSCDCWVFAVGYQDKAWQVSIQVEERARYTTTVLVSQLDDPLYKPVQGKSVQVIDVKDDNKAGSDTLLTGVSLSPQLTVRLYHDARMAEVIAWQRHRHVRARYEYPNRQMYQCDEKAQFNQFLGDWLSHCLDRGHAVHDLVALGLA